MLILQGSIIITIFKSKYFFVSKWWRFRNWIKLPVSETFELKFLNGCHFEMKNVFDLKIFMMIDPNKNNIQPEVYKI
jgi:hypothetical protein